MSKPIPIIILSFMAMLNGSAALVLGIVTLRGNKILFTPDGYGPNRIAVSELFGPLADQTGWIVLVIGVFFVLIGYGLFTMQKWARLTVIWASAVLAGLTFFAVGWGVLNSEWGVIAGGLLKIAVEAILCWYLSTRTVRETFSN